MKLRKKSNFGLVIALVLVSAVLATRMLKERIVAVMKLRKMSTYAIMLALFMVSALFMGAMPASPANAQPNTSIGGDKCRMVNEVALISANDLVKMEDMGGWLSTPKTPSEGVVEVGCDRFKAGLESQEVLEESDCAFAKAIKRSAMKWGIITNKCPIFHLMYRFTHRLTDIVTQARYSEN